MKTPKDKLIDLQYRQIQALYNQYSSLIIKLDQLQTQLNYYERKNHTH